MKSSTLSSMNGAPAHTAKQLLIQACPGAQNPQRARPMSAIFINSRRKVVVMKAVEKVVEEEVEREMEEGGWREMMEKCREEGRAVGMVEVMECLEREAIMGEDEGKEPEDYNRRAHIFDTSSKLFQALNQTQPST